MRGRALAGALKRRARFMWGSASPADLAAEDAVRLAYRLLLRREPDAVSLPDIVDSVASGARTINDVVDQIRCSDEFRIRTPIGPHAMFSSLHLSRCEFITGLPPAKRIIDLGGSHSANPWGALVLLGYPYWFDQLTIVDLPPDDRHGIYRTERYEDVETWKGPVHYEFRSMTDLSFAGDDTVDLIYSGQSIEHVTPSDGDIVLKEAARVLKPGGHVAIDTPNGAVCRLGGEDFIDPDHKVEYTLAELIVKIEAAGLVVEKAQGLNLAHRSVEVGELLADDVAAHPGVFADAERCFVLAVTAIKPR